MNNDNRNFGGSHSYGTGTTGSIGSTGNSSLNSGISGTSGYGSGSFGTTSHMGSSGSDFTANSPDRTTGGGLESMLKNLGVDLGGLKGKMGNVNMNSVRDKVSNVDVRQSVDKARNYAAANPGKVLGGLAALVIGAGLLRGRSM